MRYTLDGSEPTLQSTPYTAPIRINHDATLKIATLLPSGLKSPTRTISVQKQSLSPALPEPDSLRSGLSLNIADGLYTSCAMLAANVEWTGTTAKALEEITRQKHNGYYSAVAEGLVRVPQDGVWFFRANYPEVWIDGRKVVDNTDHWVLDGNRGGRSMALAKGLHRIKVVFLGYNASGRPTYWDNGQILWRHQDAEKYEKIKPEALSH